MLRSQEWVLSIDFGTTTTAGAMRADGDGELVEIDNAPRMPSMICWKKAENGTPGRLLIGDEAENEAALAPEYVERVPKRQLRREFILLGSEPVRVTEAIGQIFQRVIEGALLRQNKRAPRELRLTHPARWGEKRQEKLREAASFAGYDEPVLVPEPVGAAVYFAEKELSPGDHVAVYDLGGGTFDTAVLERTHGGFKVIGKPGGIDELGGEDFDQLLYRHLGAQLDPEHWQMLTSADADVALLRAHYDFRRDVRKAKELLSRRPDAKVRAPIAGTPDLEVTRADFERLIAGDIDATIRELERTVEKSAGHSIEQLAAIYLAGGSSQIPLVFRKIEERFGAAPSQLGDPKGVIALGATRVTVETTRPHTPIDGNGHNASTAAPPRRTGARASGSTVGSDAVAKTKPGLVGGPEPAQVAHSGTAASKAETETTARPEIEPTAAAPTSTAHTGGGHAVPTRPPGARMAQRTVSLKLAGGALAVAGSVAVIVSLLLPLTHGISAWHAAFIQTRYPVISTLLAAFAAGLVATGVAQRRPSNLLVSTWIGAFVIGSAFPYSQFSLIGLDQLSGIGYWLCPLGGLLIVVGSLTASAEALKRRAIRERGSTVVQAMAASGLVLLIVALALPLTVAGSYWSDDAVRTRFPVIMTLLAVIGVVLIAVDLRRTRWRLLVLVAALSALLLGQAFPLWLRDYTGLKIGYWLAAAGAAISLVVAGIAELRSASRGRRDTHGE